MRITITEDQVLAFEQLGYTIHRTIEVDLPPAVVEGVAEDATDTPTQIQRQHTRPQISTNTPVEFVFVNAEVIPSAYLEAFHRSMERLFAERNWECCTRGELNHLMHEKYPELKLNSVSSRIAEVINFGGLRAVDNDPIKVSFVADPDLFKIEDEGKGGDEVAA